MKCFGLSLACLLLAVVRAEDKTPANGDFDLLENNNEDKSPEKKWIQDNQSFQSQPAFSLQKEFPSLSTQNEKGTSKGQERAKQENTFKDFVAYEAIQSILLNALKPKPIVDTADESEKLSPNDGSKLQALGGLVVRGSETLSKALNSVIDTPKKAITKLSAGATQALNQLGAYLIGL